jgi:YHS domain-containing protein
MRSRYGQVWHACLLTGMLVGLPTQTVAAGEINVGYFGNVAIEGYDTVAYFTEGKPVRGTQKFSYTWLGSDWYFANEKHRKLFSDNPISYAPQYGGHCADGVAGGEVYVNIEPDVWKIIDGKLYLSGSDALAIEAGSDVMAKAEANWPKLRADLVAR